MLRLIRWALRLVFGGREKPDRRPTSPSPLRQKGGLVGSRNVVGYTIRSRDDRILYVGITNHPEARADEHWEDGKRFNYLKVETRPMPRTYARRWETKMSPDPRNVFRMP